MVLKVGDPAPAFEAPDQNGAPHSLQEYAGKQVLLYFYPQDNTSGCTTEACSFRDHYSELQKLVTIVGVSADSIESHQGFATKYKLPFTLLADPEKKIITAYGIGTTFYKRSSFLIDDRGIIIKIYDHVTPETHTQEILHDINQG